VLILRNLPSLLLLAVFTAYGCHAQTTPQSNSQSAASVPGQLAKPGKPISPELTRRIEVLLRQKADLPPESTVNVGERTTSDLPGWDTVSVTVTNEGSTSHPIVFYVADDGKTLAQMSRFDISADPRALVSDSGRPSRGGPENAPVLIVGFDDLECPYCAKFHTSLFPALTDRYGDKVRIVYKDYPLPADMHPWAMRAAVDVNCLATQSPSGYWTLVDYMHSHASEISAPFQTGPIDKTLSLVNQNLDKITHDQGVFQKVDVAKLDACVAKQDTTGIAASQKYAEGFKVDATPTLFINGDKISGDVSVAFVFNLIDTALRVQGVTPPPPYVAPPAPAPTPQPAATKPAPAPAAK
jgi:protein-disulfide isomerase